jgi:CheY-like chemotaxis protein
MNEGIYFILVAEDCDALQFVVAKQLERLGKFKTSFVTNGHQAIEKAKEIHYSLILMDVMLPGIDGCEATKQIRKHEAESGTSHTPIIAISAYSERARCEQSGMDDFVSKPVLLKDLESILHRWLQQSEGS